MHNRTKDDIADLSRTLTKDYGVWRGEDDNDHLGNIAGFIGWLESERDRLLDERAQINAMAGATGGPCRPKN